MKGLILIFLILFLCFSVSAIQINEVELNPESGNEWVEIYNNEGQDINISNWELYEGLSTPKSIYIFPKNTIINSGDYYIAELNNARTLNNGGDFVTLYDDNLTKIDETDLLEDPDKDSKTQQLCDSEWSYIESTKGQENNCSIEVPSQNTTNSTTNTTSSNSQDPEPEQEVEEDQEEIKEIEKISSQNKQPKETQTIELNSNTQIIEDTKPLNNKNYSPYYLLTFCGLLIFLYLLKEQSKKRTKKNEFR